MAFGLIASYRFPVSLYSLSLPFDILPLPIDYNRVPHLCLALTETQINSDSHPSHPAHPIETASPDRSIPWRIYPRALSSSQNPPVIKHHDESRRRP